MTRRKSLVARRPAETIALTTGSLGGLVLGLLYEWFRIDLSTKPWTTALIMLVVGFVPTFVTWLKTRGR